MMNILKYLFALILFFNVCNAQVISTSSFSQTTQAIKQVPFSVTYNFTRPGDTTQYTVNDALSNSTSSATQISFTIGSSNQSGVIEEIDVYSSRVGSPLAQIMAWVSGNTLASATFLDNSAIDIDNATFILGVESVALVETSSVASRARMAASGLNIPFTLDSSGKLYMILSLLNTYTPGNAEVFYIVVRGVLR